MNLNTANIEGKFYISAFPKAGLHLLDLMLRPMAMPMAYNPTWNTPWAGMYRGNSWTTEMVPQQQITLKISRLIPGHFLKGHLGYTPEMSMFLFLSGITHYIVYRDLRDIAVSQTYHILDEENLLFSHPDKQMFWDLGGFDEILEAVLIGLDKYAGLFDRWKLYAPWLNSTWAMAMRFEDVIADPLTWAKKMILHFYDRMETVLDIDPEGRQLSDKQLEEIAMEMVATSLRTGLSPTFRKGVPGEWKIRFNDRHKDLFKQLDEENWLVKLDYEKDKEW